MDTAGRSVLFAGIVVVIAVSALVAAQLPFMTAYAVAVALVVGFTISVAITLLPALLGFAGIASTSGASSVSSKRHRIPVCPLVHALADASSSSPRSTPFFQPVSS